MSVSLCISLREHAPRISAHGFVPAQSGSCDRLQRRHSCFEEMKSQVTILKKQNGLLRQSLMRIVPQTKTGFTQSYEAWAIARQL
mmetsp:Transcript_101764/g.186083  ORF Transcript_101764/g.186083 Transcript_101764/m.186083 type:complete len:85 (-) Transcript_101764:1871-2125(-)